jgi:proteasome lid subunit RPN8/RPN11
MKARASATGRRLSRRPVRPRADAHRTRTQLHGQLSRATDPLAELRRTLFRGRRPAPPQEQAPPSPLPAVQYRRLARVRLTDGVGHTLFEEFAAHRATASGDVETGWVLLGLRDADEAVVLATLPAGADADAGVAHVRFNSDAQAVASRIVRQQDRRLTILGVVHTHPGSLRRPSDGDFRGDSRWVKHLRGGDGVFGIGTADAPPPAGGAPDLVARQPRPHVQLWGGLRFSWYGLAAGDADYRPMPVEVTYGPDLARPLHALWPALEAHAARIDRLARQQAGLRFEVADDDWGPSLVLNIPLAEAGDAVRVLVRPKEVRYYLVRQGEVYEVDHADACLDRGVYLLLAELAARS